jgi:MOSC domain-containing protein YiiM
MNAPPSIRPHLLSVNTGRTEPLVIHGRRIVSAIGKRQVPSAVGVGPLGLTGDEQADPTVHGGLEKAVYMYPAEHLDVWRTLRREHGASLFDEPLPFGFVGENLSIQGLNEHEVWIGDELHFPDCVLRVSAPREPCFKFDAVMGIRGAGRLMMDQLCCGWYLRVVQTGSIEAGQTFRLEPGPRGLSVAAAFAAKRAKHMR